MEYNKELLKITGNDPRVYAGIWNKWKQINPDTRIERTDHHTVYIPRVREMVIKPPKLVNRDGIRAALWRKIGKAFNRPKWEKRGMQWDEIAAPSIDTEEIRFERFGYTDPMTGTRRSWGMAYHAQTDTLYVMR